MKKKIIIAIIVVIIVGVLVYVLLSFNKNLDETSAFLVGLKETIGLDFSEVQDVEFNWFINNDQVIIEGKGIETKDINYDQYEKVVEFFNQEGFDSDKFNLAIGALNKSLGYKKDNMVCVFEITMCDECLNDESEIVDFKELTV